MARLTSIEPGQLFAEAEFPSIIWRVDMKLSDGIHVRLVRTDQPRRFKTFSVSALADSKLFVPATDS